MSADFTNKMYSFQSWPPLKVLSNIKKIHPPPLPKVIFKCLTQAAKKQKGKKACFPSHLKITQHIHCEQI